MKTQHMFIPLVSSVFLFASMIAANGAVDVGAATPSLVAKTLDGSSFNVGSERGHVLIVNFWATWCAPCRAEMPALDMFYRQYHAQGLDLIGVSVDRERDRSDAVRVMASFSYPSVMLSDAQENGFGKPKALPITYVIDATGVVRAVLTPDKTPIDAKTLNEIVLPLIAKP
jgi:thiol-disulfide isomerase/thioredoxin